MKQFLKYFKNKKDHYLISDSFSSDERYRQKREGYIRDAKIEGLEINIKKAEPNQKWHFFHYYSSISHSSRNPKACYGDLKCPELLLWIAEAAGIDSSLVNIAATHARKIIDEGLTKRSRNIAAKKIKEIIPWSMISDKVSHDTADE